VPEPTYAIELTPPDIEPYRAGNTGIDYVTTFDSGLPGPHVLVTALTHGNEICGAIALDRLFRAGLRPRQGKLTLAFDNVAAYQRFDRRVPTASRFVDEDFNRLWSPATLDGVLALRGEDGAERAFEISANPAAGLPVSVGKWV